jgi:hypothetical protein
MSLVLCEQRRSAPLAKEPRDPIAFFGQRPMLPCSTLGDDHVLTAHDHGVRWRTARDVLAVPTMARNSKLRLSVDFVADGSAKTSAGDYGFSPGRYRARKNTGGAS